MQAAADESKFVMDDFYLFGDLDDLDEAEDVEVPKALGDIFESIAGKNVPKLEKIVKNNRILYFLNSFLPWIVSPSYFLNLLQRRRTGQKSRGPVVMWWA